MKITLEVIRGGMLLPLTTRNGLAGTLEDGRRVVVALKKEWNLYRCNPAVFNVVESDLLLEIDDEEIRPR